MKREEQHCSDDVGEDDFSLYVTHVETSFQPMDISFHPYRDNLVSAALVDGTVEVHDFRKDEEDGDDDFDSLLSSLSLHTPSHYKNDLLLRQPHNTSSCKCVAFSTDGSKIFSGGSHGDLCAVDAERACTFSTDDKNQPLWRVKSATVSLDDRAINSEYNTNKSKNNPLVALHPFRKDGDAGTFLLATGDDYGGIRIWDQRICGGGNGSQFSSKRPRGCVLEWNEQEDYISGIEYSAYNSGKNTAGNDILLATSADGSLGVYDLRMNKGSIPDATRTSDHLDDELLSLCVLKSGKKVVCGTQTGALSIFSWGTWGDISDRFPGHPSSVEALLKIDEDTILTGSSDGMIRVVQIHPDKFLGVLNDSDSDSAGHRGYPIEKLDYNANKSVVGSVSHNNFVRLWDARILKDDGIDDEDYNDEDDYGGNAESDSRKPPAIARSAVAKSSNAVKNNSDDEWEDMDDDNNDCDHGNESDSDESASEPETANDRRRKRLKTEKEKFFDDL